MSTLFEIDLDIGHAAINRKFVSRSFRLRPEYATFKRDLAEFFRSLKVPPLEGPVLLEVFEGWARTNRQGPALGLALGDVDSPLKCIQDALKDGGAYFDDGQITRLYAEKSVRETTLIRVSPAGALRRP